MSQYRTATSRISQWFQFFDGDVNGEISFEEMLLSLKKLQFKFNPADHQLLSDLFDVDANGLLDWADFFAYLDKSHLPRKPPRAMRTIMRQV